jgi:hypothetical protein
MVLFHLFVVFIFIRFFLVVATLSSK